MNYVLENKKWVCVHVSDSLFEANLLRSLLESKGIHVTLCASSSQFRDYIRDQGEKVRIFIPAEDFEQGRYFTSRLIHLRDHTIQHCS